MKAGLLPLYCSTPSALQDQLSKARAAGMEIKESTIAHPALGPQVRGNSCCAFGFSFLFL